MPFVNPFAVVVFVVAMMLLLVMFVVLRMVEIRRELADARSALHGAESLAMDALLVLNATVDRAHAESLLKDLASELNKARITMDDLREASEDRFASAAYRANRASHLRAAEAVFNTAYDRFARIEEILRERVPNLPASSTWEEWLPEERIA